MARRPIAFISFRFEPRGDSFLFDDPSSRVKTGRLNLIIWRRNAKGHPEESEVHSLGEARDGKAFDQMVDDLKRDLERARGDGRDWFGPGKPFWR